MTPPWNALVCACHSCARIVIALVALLAGMAFPVARAGEVSIRRWHADEGLPDERVYSIVQSTDGYLWIATDRGVCRFDGVRFTPMLVPQLPMSGRKKCQLLHAAPDGAVWGVFEKEGIVRWSASGVSVFGPTEGMPAEQILSLCADKAGALFASFRNAGIIRIVGGKVSALDAGSKHSNEWTFVAADAQGKVWRTADRALEGFDGGAFQWEGTVGAVRRSLIAAHGGFWIPTSGGSIAHYVPGAGFGRRVELPAGSGVVSALCEDSQGTLWIGTRAQPGSGLYRVDPHSDTPAKIVDGQVMSLTSDREGNLWVATTADGMLQIRPRMMRFLENEHPGAYARVESFAVDHAGRAWLVGTGALFRQRDPGFEAVPPFIPRNRSGAAWVENGANDSVLIGSTTGLFQWREGDETATEHPMQIREPIGVVFRSRQGDIWLASLGDSAKVTRVRGDQTSTWQLPAGTSPHIFVEDSEGGIYFDAGGSRIFRVWNDKLQPVEFPGAGEYPIHALCCDADGNLWIGFTGGGIGRHKNGKLIRATMAEGLPDNSPGQLLLDLQGRLWVHSDTDIYHFDRADFEAFAAGRKKRLQVVSLPDHERQMNVKGIVRSVGYSCRNMGDELWFTAGNRVVIVDPVAQIPSQVPPTVTIEAFRVDGRELPFEPPAATRVQLSPDHHRLEFDYTAPSFSVPANVQFRYLLEGYSGDWVEAGPSRRAVYSRLAAGDYIFRVIACNSDGIWNETGVAVAFTVAPFVWQRWWFQAAVLGVAVLMGVVVSRKVANLRLRRRLQMLEQKQMVEKERARIARNLHDDLGGTLTEMGMLADLGARDGAPPEEYRQTIVSFSERVRGLARTLDTVVWAADPSNDTLRELAAYLTASAQELFRATSIRFRLSVEGEIPALPLSPESRSNLFFTAKEAMTNLIKHSGATEARLRIRMEGSQFCMGIEDNGAGFSPDDPRHARRHGIANMRARIEELGGTFAIRSNAAEGTVIEITVSFAGRGELQDTHPAAGKSRGVLPSE